MCINTKHQKVVTPKVKRKTKYLKSNKITPLNELIALNRRVLAESQLERENELRHFLSEKIICHNCGRVHDLTSKSLNLHCNRCNKFYCCGIAGECVGNSCRVKIGDRVCRQRFCVKCAGAQITDSTCLCLDCMKNA